MLTSKIIKGEPGFTSIDTIEKCIEKLSNDVTASLRESPGHESNHVAVLWREFRAVLSEGTWSTNDLAFLAARCVVEIGYRDLRREDY